MSLESFILVNIPCPACNRPLDIDEYPNFSCPCGYKGVATRKNIDAWKLWHSMFKHGDSVVVITEDEKFGWGVLVAYDDEGFTLRRPHSSKSHSFEWDSCRFMAHDGFPVRRLMGADGSATIASIDDAKPEAMIREAMGLEFEEIVFSDPFLIEGVRGSCANPGRVWTPGDWAFEETLMLYAPDGARGMLWGFQTVHHVRAAV